MGKRWARRKDGRKQSRWGPDALPRYAQKLRAASPALGLPRSPAAPSHRRPTPLRSAPRRAPPGASAQRCRLLPPPAARGAAPPALRGACAGFARGWRCPRLSRRVRAGGDWCRAPRPPPPAPPAHPPWNPLADAASPRTPLGEGVRTSGMAARERDAEREQK